VHSSVRAQLKANNNFMKVYSPTDGDECYVNYDDEGDGVSIDPLSGCQVDGETVACAPPPISTSGFPRERPARASGADGARRWLCVCRWWHMSCGRVLGVYDGRLIEYEPSTLAPLGLVVGQDELRNKRVVVVGSGIPEECKVSTASVSSAVGMEGADCVEAEAEEQAVLLVDDETGMTTVVQTNEDGSYWRKIVRNKMIRMKEKRRLQAAKAFAAEEFPSGDDEV
jgi:hypothetical protein